MMMCHWMMRCDARKNEARGHYLRRVFLGANILFSLQVSSLKALMYAELDGKHLSRRLRKKGVAAAAQNEASTTPSNWHEVNRNMQQYRLSV
jgi:hypothetical protein